MTGPDYGADLSPAALEQTVTAPPEWVRPAGFAGPCPECGSVTCPGYYKPDGSHRLAF